jgi:drug/metabolite transporter (DMT)-like permease
LTRLAVEGLSPLFIGSARAVVAAVMAAAALLLTRQRLPRGVQWLRLAVVAGGVVVGFPMLTSFALTAAPASHAAVVIALLPAATATTAVLRGRERPRVAFWVATGAGAIAAVGFAVAQPGGFGQLQWTDLLFFGAVLAAAVGYAEGGLLARELGAWQTISWALVLASPLMAVLVAVSVSQRPPSATPVQWAALAYLGVVSMFLGFIAWYHGLAIGPMAQVSQVQLAQPRDEHLLGCASARRAADVGNRPQADSPSYSAPAPRSACGSTGRQRSQARQPAAPRPTGDSSGDSVPA